MDTVGELMKRSVEDVEKPDGKELEEAEDQGSAQEPELAGVETEQVEEEDVEQEKMKEENPEETEEGKPKDARAEKCSEQLDEDSVVKKDEVTEKKGEQSSETDELSVEKIKLADCGMKKDETVENNCKMFEESRVSQTEDAKSKLAESKNAEEMGINDDSGLGALADSSHAAAEQSLANMEETKENSGNESLGEVSKEESSQESDAAKKEEVAAEEPALVLVVTPAGGASPSALLEQVREDMEWFDVPGVEVAEVEGELEVAVGDRELGMTAMAGLRHKYNIKPKVSLGDARLRDLSLVQQMLMLAVS